MTLGRRRRAALRPRRHPPGRRPPSGPPTTVVCAGARGNVVLAEHGASLPPVAALWACADRGRGTGAAARPAGARGRPPLAAAGAGDGPAAPASRRHRARRRAPASGRGPARRSTAAECLPAIALRDAFSTWTARPDLLASGRLRPRLRRRGRRHGRRRHCASATASTALEPAVRAKLGVEGRFGARHRRQRRAGRTRPRRRPGTAGAAPIGDVTNPLAGRGGAAPESAAVIRAAAPEAFRTPQRAVTAPDYAGRAATPRRRQRGGRRALDRLLADRDRARRQGRWTRRWTPSSARALLAHLETYRLAGFDVAVRPAKPVPLDIELAGLRGARRDPQPGGAAGARATLTPVGPDGALGLLPPRPVHLRHAALPVGPRRRGDGGAGRAERHAGRVPALRARSRQGELGLGVIRPGRHRGARARRRPELPRARPAADPDGRWAMTDDGCGCGAGTTCGCGGGTRQARLPGRPGGVLTSRRPRPDARPRRAGRGRRRSGRCARGRPASLDDPGIALLSAQAGAGARARLEPAPPARRRAR